jgi:DNA-binding transcriptional LysR family regulator
VAQVTSAASPILRAISVESSIGPPRMAQSILPPKPKGHLRIAIGGSTARDVLIPLLADFMTTWPDIRIFTGDQRRVFHRSAADGAVNIAADQVRGLIGHLQTISQRAICGSPSAGRPRAMC